jgi:DnaD/phage-associated family protein
METLHRVLEAAVGRGTFLHLISDEDGKQRELYFLNTEAGREAMDRMCRGELSPGETETEEKPNIFAMYEQNIGMLTPMIVEELKEAEEVYPTSWIEDAFREAVSLNKRSWRYIVRILERWSSEGRYRGEPGRHPEKWTDPDKYIRGKYGHVVKRRIT